MSNDGAHKGLLAHAVWRLGRAWTAELGGLAPRRVIAESTANLLPAQSFSRTRTAMFRAAGVHIGEHSLIFGPLRLTGIGDICDLLWIGSNTHVTGELRVDLGAPVRIGDWVRIGHDVVLLTIDHAIGPEYFRTGVSRFAPIEIGDGTWIASRVTVLPGVKIGAGAVVAAGAVVKRDVPPNTLVAGVPARVVRNLASDEPVPSSRF